MNLATTKLDHLRELNQRYLQYAQQGEKETAQALLEQMRKISIIGLKYDR